MHGTVSDPGTSVIAVPADSPMVLTPSGGDDTQAIQALLDEAGDRYAQTGLVTDAVLAAGDYTVSRSSTRGCLSIPSGVRLRGPGRLRLAAGQSTQTRILVIEDKQHVVVDGLTIDGNSGAQAGGTDPKSHAIFVRGSRDVSLRNITGVDIDGDMFYFGKSATSENPDPYARQCLVENFWVDGTRRSLVTITAGACDITIRGGYGVNWSGDQSAALNIESDTAASSGCVFDGIYLDDPRQERPHTSFAVSVSQGHGTRITNCRLPSTVVVTGSDDVTIEDNVIAHPGLTWAGGSGIQARLTCERLTIRRNTISVAGPPPERPARFHAACIHVLHTNERTPKDVVIEGNHLLPGEGLAGIWCTSLAGTTTLAGNLIDGGGSGRGISIVLDGSDLPFTDVRVHGNTIMNVASPRSTCVRILNDSTVTAFGSIAITDNRFVQAVGTDCAIRFDPSNALGRAGFGQVTVEGNERTPTIAREAPGITD